MHYAKERIITPIEIVHLQQEIVSHSRHLANFAVAFALPEHLLPFVVEWQTLYEKGLRTMK